ncbi:MAG TPA: hypothetical protein PLV64_05355 [Anaerolineales bacterium]|nr:hypothetical protein [Anaerolineales bacterium]
MSSTHEHNYALQQVRYFTAEDLEANRKGQYSQAQLDRFKNERDFIQQSSGKYEKKGWLISLIFGAFLLFFAVVLYFLGVVDMFQNMLGSLFLPVMAGLCLLAALFVFVIAPRSYQSSVDMYKSMGTPMEQQPLGAIQTIEARARAYESRAGLDRNLHSVSSRVSYVLEMDSIKFLITESLMKLVEDKRLYRVYCVNDGGAWLLLSMETLE